MLLLGRLIFRQCSAQIAITGKVLRVLALCDSPKPRDLQTNPKSNPRILVFRKTSELKSNQLAQQKIIV